MTDQHTHDCHEIINQLNEYIDGDLDAVLCKNVEDHLSNCPDCQVVLNTIKKTIHLYKEDGEKTILPQETRRRLFACLGLDDDVN